jgi:membrane fusion protein (multidrug efflux system)
MRHPLAILLLACVAGCAPAPAPVAPARNDETSAPVTNRIAIPEAVRANLGITFARVESRAVAATLRVPGRFEALPAATWPYRAHAAGRVTFVAKRFSDVAAGDVLFRLESPEWSTELQALRDASSAEAAAHARLSALERLIATQQQALDAANGARTHWNARVQELADVLASGAGVADALAEARGQAVASTERVAQAQLELERLRAESEATALEAARLASAVDTGMRNGAARAGLDVLRFALDFTENAENLPALAVRAVRAGRVTDVAAEVGSWLDTDAHVLTVVDKDAVLFRASVLQSDIGLLREGATCRIAAPVVSERSRSIGVGQSISGRLHVAPVANAHDNTIDVLVEPLEAADWSRPGVFARLEVEYDATAAQVLSVPLSAIQRDGLVPVVFRRDPQDPDKVIRLEADLGLDDGRWIELKSGVRAGDEVVLDGAFQLLLASSGSMQRGGHFHADGTFHEGED